MIVPVEQQRAVIFSEASADEPNLWFRIMYVLTTTVFIVYNTLYPFLNLRNIRRYRKFIVNYSSDAYNASLAWLAVIQALILITVPVPLAGLLFRIPTIFVQLFLHGVGNAAVFLSTT